MVVVCVCVAMCGGGVVVHVYRCVVVVCVAVRVCSSVWWCVWLYVCIGVWLWCV